MDMNASQTAGPSALPYHEPSITTILTQSSFLLLLNGLNHILDKLLYCGLIGQVLLGVAYGNPSLNPLLPTEAQQVIVQLGYLGLLLLVFEGGLNTNFVALKANLWLSAAVALTGIVVPIGLSFVLIVLADATPRQAFSAGAALCSTSLGTTFTVMGATGLASTRMGVVLTSAAMMDDVVGLVMVQVVTNLGDSGSSFSYANVARPVLVSIAFAVIIPLVAWLASVAFAAVLNRHRQTTTSSSRGSMRLVAWPAIGLVTHTLLLTGLVAGSSYAGTSNLFAAYIAGALISWWDSNFAPSQRTCASATSDASDQHSCRSPEKNRKGLAVFEHYYAPALNRILQPFFFASIGFSIPVTRMFSGSIVWRGLVYTMLMILGKGLCGLWLVRLSPRDWGGRVVKLSTKATSLRSRLTWSLSRLGMPQTWLTEAASAQSPLSPTSASQPQTLQSPRALAPVLSSSQSLSTTAKRIEHRPPPPEQKTSAVQPGPHKPFSLYPAAIVSAAMVSRGEIGFLISSVAESNGSFASVSGGDDIFLTVTWAIVLCTIVGPMVVGGLVRRVRRLELEKGNGQNPGTSGHDVLGVWGVR